MGSYQSVKTGTEIDNSVLLSAQNKTDIATLNAAPAITKIAGIRTATITISATFDVDIAQDFTGSCPGASVGDVVIPFSTLAAGFGAITLGGANPLQVQACWVSAADVVKARLYSAALSGSTTYSFTLSVLVIKLQ